MNNKLDETRKNIDEVDMQILELLSKRMKLVSKVGILKKQNNIPPLDSKRWKSVLNSKLAVAFKLGLDQKMIKDIYENIHAAALELEALISKNKI